MSDGMEEEEKDCECTSCGRMVYPSDGTYVRGEDENDNSFYGFYCSKCMEEGLEELEGRIEEEKIEDGKRLIKIIKECFGGGLDGR